MRKLEEQDTDAATKQVTESRIPEAPVYDERAAFQQLLVLVGITEEALAELRVSKYVPHATHRDQDIIRIAGKSLQPHHYRFLYSLGISTGMLGGENALRLYPTEQERAHPVFEKFLDMLRTEQYVIDTNITRSESR